MTDGKGARLIPAKSVAADREEEVTGRQERRDFFSSLIKSMVGPACRKKSR